MNKKQWLQMLQHTDEKYIEEAAPEAPRKKRRWPGVLAACLCCVMAASAFFLFKPLPDELPETDQYEKSNYYDLIQVLNKLNYQLPLYGNNYEMLVDEILGGKGNLEMIIEDSRADGVAVPDTQTAADIPGEPANDSGTSSYQEITDNQVLGVTEADRIKRTDRHIFYLDGSTLRVFSIAADATQEVGKIALGDALKAGGATDQWEFYLSADGRYVNVIAPCLDENNRRQLQVVCLDVSDPQNIGIVNTFGVSGQNISSRVAGESLLLMTRYRPEGEMDFTDETTFVPQLQYGGETKSIPSDKIVIPENPIHKSYVVVMKLDMATLKLHDCVALLSFEDKLYVSRERVYAVNEYVQEPSENCTNDMTQVVWIDYSGDSFGTGGSIAQNSVHVDGFIKDQYSMDEHEGILRMATTTQKMEQTEIDFGHTGSASYVSVTTKTSANLYCIDLQTAKIAGKVEQFAPEGESVRSVRFDGTDAYVCTAVELTDPVFFFDLSDVNNITYKDTGNIEGFSSSLVNFGNGYLLGIGRGANWDTLKVEVYAEGADAVESVCSFELEQVYWSENYKSYYIDRQNQLLGLGYGDQNGETRYTVLLFDGYEINAVLDTELAGETELMRGVYIEDWFYMFGSEMFKTEKLF